MSGSRRFVENLKNVILVVLFITTILLLYLLWSEEPSRNLDISEILPFSGNRESMVSCSDVVLPSSVAWGEGDGSFQYETVNMEEAQEYYIERLRELYQGTVLVYTITENEYYQAVKQSKSSVLQWDVNIPYDEFCSYNKITDAVGEGIDSVSVIAISQAAKDSIIIYDAEKKTYYRLAVEGAEFIPYSGKEETEPAESGIQSIYYPSDVVLGSASAALLPIMESSTLDDCRYEQESEKDGEELGVSMAEAIFGDTFDFVRRITDDFGTTTYMYGYGQKTLTANSDGTFEYKAETSGESGGFYDDLKTALDFVSTCGGWEVKGVEEIKYKLVEATYSGNGKDMSYTFSFAAFIKDYQVYSEENYPIVVGVTNGQVSYYYRNAIRLMAFAENSEQQVSDAANVIANNAGHMYKVMNDDALSPDTDEAFSYVSNGVKSMKKGYFKYSSDSSIVPCWTVSMNDGSKFFFDLYEGAPLGFTR